jgi:hypothetical protein
MIFIYYNNNTSWFKYDRVDLCVNKSQFVPVIFEPPCIIPSDQTKNFSLLKLIKKHGGNKNFEFALRKHRIV